MDNFKNQSYFNNNEVSLDSLTQVLNRESIMNYAQFLVSNQIPFSFAICDIDNFKYVNDTYGHLVGDQILSDFALYLKSVFADNGIVGRYGGDEFIIVLEKIVEYTDVWDMFHTFNVKLADFKSKELEIVNVTATSGISRFPQDSNTVKGLFLCGDKALYRGKAKGRNCFVIYNEEKHGNIQFDEVETGFRSPVDLHAKIFDILSYNNSPKKNIKSLLRFLSAFMMTDHIGIQSNDRLLATILYNNGPFYSFSFIQTKLMDRVANNIGVVSFNQSFCLKKIGYTDILEEVNRQEIKAAVWIKIQAYGKKYGYLRAEMVTKYRVWQHEDINILLTSARLIGIVLHYLNKDLDEIFDEKEGI